MQFHGKPQRIAESHLKSRWLRGKPGEYCRCAFCGKKFVLGDYFRIITTNHKKIFGNPITCEGCDTMSDEAMVRKWEKKWESWKTGEWETTEDGKFWWWFIRYEAEQEAIKMEREDAKWMRER